MSKVYKISDKRSARTFARDFAKGIAKPVRNALPYFQQLAIMIDNDTQMQFRTQGKRKGLSISERWPSFNNGRGVGFYDTKRGSSTRSALGTWKIRYGTDKSPKRTKDQLKAYKSKNNLWYKPGKMKGYKSDRRYSQSSKLLQASGQFRQSFKPMGISKKGLVYRSNHRLAGKIGASPRREVLVVTDTDLRRYQNKFRLFIDNGITF